MDLTWKIVGMVLVLGSGLTAMLILAVSAIARSTLFPTLERVGEIVAGLPWAAAPLAAVKEHEQEVSEVRQRKSERAGIGEIDVDDEDEE